MGTSRGCLQEIERLAKRIMTARIQLAKGKLPLEDAVDQVGKALARWTSLSKPPEVKRSESNRQFMQELRRFHRRRMKVDPVFGSAYRRDRRVKSRILKDASRLAGVTDPQSLAFFRDRLVERWKAAPKLMAADDDAMWAVLKSWLDQADARLDQRRPDLDELRRDAARQRLDLVRRVSSLSKGSDLAEAFHEVNLLKREWKALPKGHPQQDARLWRRFAGEAGMVLGAVHEPEEMDEPDGPGEAGAPDGLEETDGVEETQKPE